MSLLTLFEGPAISHPPSGFGYTPPFLIYEDGSTSFRFDSLYEAIQPSDITEFYVSPSGSDANSGLTPALPKRSIPAALTLSADAATPWVRINLANGDYQHGFQPGASFPNKNVIMNGAGGQLYIGSFVRGNGLSWTNTTGTTYSATRSGVYGVRSYASFNNYGDPIKYVLAASQAACEATPNSFFVSGSTVYVNNGVGQPGQSIVLLLLATNTRFSVDKTLIVDAGANGRIDFIGSDTSCLRVTGTSLLSYYSRNTWYKFASSNCFESIGGGLTLNYGGGVSGSVNDGFNYHLNGATLPTAIEINVSAFDCGVAAGNTQNCSSMHDGGAVIRVNSSYNGALGPVVVDVNDGTRSWNIRCDARNCLTNHAGATDASWCVFTGTSKMWLDHCTYGAGTSTSLYDLSVDVGSTMYLKGTIQGTSNIAGTLTTYY